MQRLIVFAQHGPALVNYTVAQYRAHNQNWSVTQSDDRKMYVGNTDGLLTFDGNTWQLNRLPSGKIVRAVHASGRRIYSGAYGEIGYWQADECNQFSYTDLTPSIPKAWIEKEEIWNIVEAGGHIYFQSFSLLLRFDGQKMEKVGLPGSIMFLHKVHDKLLIQSLGFGIYELFPDDHIEMVAGSAFFSDKTVTGITAAKVGSADDLLVATSRHGIFTLSSGNIAVWNSKRTSYFVDVQINRSLSMHDGSLVLGTIRDGVLIFSSDGQLKHHLHTANGLQNNTVISMFEDQDGQIWLGLDRGLCVVRVHDPLHYFSDFSGTLGTVYTMAQFEDHLYVGTNQGLYRSDGGQFTLVKGTQGQVWHLFRQANHLLCGHNEGTFTIAQGEAKKICSITGGWYFCRVPGREDLLLQGTYTGLVVFQKAAHGWKFSHKVQGYNQPVKKLVIDQRGQIWVSGPNTGIALLTIDKSFSQVVKEQDFTGLQGGLPESLNLDLATIEGQVAVFDGKNHSVFDPLRRMFQKATWINTPSRPFLIRQTSNSKDKNWFKVYSDSLVWMSGRERRQAFLLKANRDYQSIAALNDGNVGFCLYEGYAVFNTNDTAGRQSNLLPLKPGRIDMTETGECIPVRTGEKVEIRYNRNSFRLHFYDAAYMQGKSYQYRLFPVSDEWKPCSGLGYTDFANLAPGQYTLWVMRAGSQALFSLEIQVLPPWYRSAFAFLFYILLLIGVFGWFTNLFNRRLKRAKRRMEQENERILREHKIQMENDRLIQDNLAKSKDLANVTMHLIQKNALLQEIKEEITAIRKTGDHVLTARDFQLIMRQINDNLTIEEDKNLFDQSFHEVHESFLKKLKADFPSLTTADLQLAAYLKMNLASKEIAPLFNIGLRGLENKRYRLRKKLGLSMDANLTDFLITRY